MLTPALQKACKTLLAQNDTSSISLCQLLRVTALTSAQPSEAVVSLCDTLKPHYGFPPLLEALAARVQDILDTEDTSRAAIEPDLDALVDQIRDWQSELADQVGAVFNSDDVVTVLAEREGVVEKALAEAEVSMSVFIVEVAPDYDEIAEGMAKRLTKKSHLHVEVIRDRFVAHALARSKKCVISALALDAEEGALLPHGSTMTAVVANRMRVPVVMTVPGHCVLPSNCGVIGNMAGVGGVLGAVWEYEEARDDSERDAMHVVGGGLEILSVQRAEVLITGGGGICPAQEVVRLLAPGRVDE